MRFELVLHEGPEPGRRAWFWITMTAIVAFHVAMILSVRWTDKWVPALVLTPIVAVDFLAILWILDTLDRFMNGPKPSAP